MQNHSGEDSSSLHRLLPIGLTILVGSVLSIVGSVVLYQMENEQLRTRLQGETQALATLLKSNIRSKIQLSETLAAFASSSIEAEREEFEQFRDEFKQFTETLLKQHDNILALAWAPRVSGSDRAAFERLVQAEGFANFQIYERSPTGERIVAQRRDVYFPVTLSEPIEKNRQAIGFDIFSEPNRRAAMEKARDTGRLTITARLNLAVQGTWGIVAYTPAYQQRKPLETQRDRQQYLRGFTFGVFTLPDLLAALSQQAQVHGLDVYLLDESAPAAQNFLAYVQASSGEIFKQPPQAGGVTAAALLAQHPLCQSAETCSRSLTIGDRQWTLIALPTAQYSSQGTHWQSWSVLLVGFLLTGGVAAYLLSSLRHTRQIEALAKERSQQAEQLSQTLQELQQTQTQLVHTERMSSLGQLVAGVAHEINNPVNFIHGNLVHVRRYAEDLLHLIQSFQQTCSEIPQSLQAQIEAIDLDFIQVDLPKTLDSMTVGTDRIRQIVLSLRNFSRLDESEMKQVDIHEGIDSTLLILQHRLKEKPGRPSIQIVKQYGELPLVECFAGQLNQVFMNLLSNAVDALEGSERFVQPPAEPMLAVSQPSSAPRPQAESRPTSAITTATAQPQILIQTQTRGKTHVLICIADNGQGMEEKVRSRLFTPFFTTKPVGRGTGLGLSISYQIVTQQHHGRLWCDSTPGEGTQFFIEIPIRQN